MTTTAQAGVFGFGPSAGKGLGVTVGDWYRHKATLVDLAILDDQRLGPPEVGGRPLPTLPYKAGVIVGGGASLNPRLEGSLGWLLGGALGGNPVTTSGSGTIKKHLFQIDDTNPGCVKWMGFRKYIPTGCEAGTDYGLGETYVDCKITSLVISLPNDGLIGARVDALGRTFTLEESPAWGTASGSAGGWAPTDGEFEDYTSIPIGSGTGGYITVPTFGELPVIQAQIGIQNMPLDTRMERVYGDPYLNDITIVSRAVTLDLTVKWTNPDLYRQILTNSVDGVAWSSTPFTSAVTILAESPAVIPTTTTPYSLKITITEAMLALSGGIQLAGNQAIMMRFTGTVLDVGGVYASFELVNDQVSYVWPT